MFAVSTFDVKIAQKRLGESVRPGDELALLRRGQRMKVFFGKAGAWRNLTHTAATICGLETGRDGAIWAERELSVIEALVGACPAVRNVRLFDV